MNYPKIDLKTIRQESKHFQADTPRLFLLYILPSMLVILSSFLNPLSRIHGTVLEQPFFSILGQILQAYLFPLLSLLYRDYSFDQFRLCNTDTHERF